EHFFRQLDLLGFGAGILLLAARPPLVQPAKNLAKLCLEFVESLAHGTLLFVIVNRLPGSAAPSLPVPGRGLPISPGWSKGSIMAASARGGRRSFGPTATARTSRAWRART